MPQGQVIEVEGIRYEAVEDSYVDVEDDPRTMVWESCAACDYKKDHKGRCGAFCCEMELYGCHFKRLD